MSDDYPTPGRNEFSADEERAMRQAAVRDRQAKSQQEPMIRRMERNEPRQSEEARNAAAMRLAAPVVPNDGWKRRFRNPE